MDKKNGKIMILLVESKTSEEWVLWYAKRI